MATPQELQDQLDQIRAKRAALASQVSGLNVQHSTSNAPLLGNEFAAMDKIRFNSALKPLLMQDRELHQQESQLIQAQNRANIDARRAVTDKNAAVKAAAQEQKQQAAAQKQASTDLEDQTARQFGLGPKKGIDYITKQGAFYDPVRGQIGVPDNKTVKTPAQKAAKGDAEAGKQVQAELSGFAKQAGVQGSVNPSSFFGDNGFDMEQDKDGNYVYDANGTPVTIPEETAKRLQEQYNSSLAPEAEAPAAPSGGVKYLSPDVVNPAINALNQLNGTNLPTPGEAYTKSQSLNRLAAPAVAQSVLGTPGPIPSANGRAFIDPTINAPSIGASLLRGHDPSWDAYVANQDAQKAATVAGRVGLDQAVQDSGGTSGSVRELAQARLDAIKAGADTPEKRNAFIRGAVEQQQQKEALLPTGGDVPFVTGLQNAAGNDIATLAPLISKGDEYFTRARALANPLTLMGLPSTMITDPLKATLAQVGEKIAPAALSGYSALTASPDEDIAKKYFAAKGRGEIGPSVTLDEYSQAINPTNVDLNPAGFSTP